MITPIDRGARIDHRAYDAHQYDSRILPDGSIAVGDGELLDLKTRLFLARINEEDTDATRPQG